MIEALAVCPRCGKEYTLKNVFTTVQTPITRVCDECRAKMKKISLTLTVYEDGFTEFGGECTFCKQFPCEHCAPDGQLFIKAGDYEISQGPLKKVKVQIVDWPLGDGGRPHQVYEEIRRILNNYGYTLTAYKSGTDDCLGWIHKRTQPIPTREGAEEMLRKDGEGLKPMPANLIFWDWKEPRKSMIADLNKAMKLLKVPLKWVYDEAAARLRMAEGK